MLIKIDKYLIKELKQYIEKHRKMWNWIADNLVSLVEEYRIKDTAGLKLKYFEEISEKDDIVYGCYICEYMEILNDHCIELGCYDCPIDWSPESRCTSMKSIYVEFTDAMSSGKYSYCVELARKISSLPLKREWQDIITADIKAKQKAIQKHRDMWNWIAKQFKNPNRNLEDTSIMVLKEEYLEKYDPKNISISNSCYLCEYDDTSDCSFCPLEWPSGSCIEYNRGLFSLIHKEHDNKNWDMCARLAKQIADLPEKKEC